MTTVQTKINGIDTDALKQAMSDISADAGKGIELEKVEIETDGELDLRGFLGLDDSVKPGYDEIRLIVRIKGNGTPEQFQEVHETVKATSPNFFNLSRPVTLKPELVVE